jgi:hypothetical protein
MTLGIEPATFRLVAKNKLRGFSPQAAQHLNKGQINWIIIIIIIIIIADAFLCRVGPAVSLNGPSGVTHSPHYSLGELITRGGGQIAR